MSRLNNLLKYFGYQGGTIHQMADATGCKAFDLLDAKPSSETINSDYSSGYFAAKTCTLAFRLKFLKEKRGNLDFWLGVADSFKGD